MSDLAKQLIDSVTKPSSKELDTLAKKYGANNVSHAYPGIELDFDTEKKAKRALPAVKTWAKKSGFEAFVDHDKEDDLWLVVLQPRKK